MKNLTQILEEFEKEVDELIPLKTDFQVIHGYINLNRKDIKNLGEFIRQQITELIESCPNLPVYHGNEINIIKEWKEEVKK